MDYIEDDYVYVISPMMSKNEQTLKLLADFLHVGNYIYETLAQAANNDLSNIFVSPYAPFNIWAGATGVYAVVRPKVKQKHLWSFNWIRASFLASR